MNQVAPAPADQPLIRRLRIFAARHFLGIETVAAILFGAAIAVWVFLFEGNETTDRLLNGQRESIYATVASISATMLGFVLTITTLVLPLSTSDRFTILRRSPHYKTLWRSLTSSIRVLFFATLVTLTALLFDREPPDSNHMIMVLSAFAVVWALLRIGATAWVLEGIIGIATIDPGNDEPPETRSPR